MSNESNKGEGAARELGGKIKKGVGALIGDEQMEAEGRAKELQGAAQKESAKAAERGKGELEEIGGAIKNRVGQVLGSDKMAAEGKVKELEGEARQKRNSLARRAAARGPAFEPAPAGGTADANGAFGRSPGRFAMVARFVASGCFCLAGVPTKPLRP